MSADTDLYQEVVVEHKRSPRNFGKLATWTHQARGRNPQCGDDISVQLQVEQDQIRDIRFHGLGCAICIASASMMTEAVRGGSVEAAQQIQQRFRAVMTGQQEPDAYLGKLISLAAVRRYPSRIKCALLGWHALAHALGDTAQGDAEAERPELDDATSAKVQP
ncbi:MAG: SUF system NifU family Fe-S cluster assembly protein [Burkholderiaceae bacterium]|nr:MAG: SUF system NifU family Fe-S cluster assembly protein [Burkholderiaceae bacterium]